MACKFVNFSNHRIELWEETQLRVARRYGELVEVPFPDVNPQASEEEILRLGEQCFDTIMAYQPNAVMCQGEFTLAVNVIERLKAAGVKVMAACSNREVTEKDGIKTSRFRFVQFRQYV